MKRQRRLYQLGAGAGLVTIVLGALMVIAPVAGAEHSENHDRNPPGNNGTVKIDGVLAVDGPGHGPGPNDPGQHPDNDPHVECLFELEFFGFDTGQMADIVFTSHAPTDEGRDPLLAQERVVISDDSAGPAGGENPDRDAELQYDLSEALADIEPHPVHGWHVKLALTLYNADGTEVPGGKKHKVFWVEGCEPTGSISVEKDVTGGGAPATGEPGEPEYAFTLACVDEGEPVDMTPDDGSTTTASFLLKDGEVRLFSDLPEGAECTITETDAQGATSTTMTVGDTVVDDADTDARDGTVTVSSTNTAVVVRNDYPAVTTPATGTVSVDKRVTGEAPSPERAYAFTVSCDAGGQPVDLNGDGAGDDMSFTLTPSAAPWTSMAIPEGAECTITETDAQGATSTTMTVGDTVVDDADTGARDGTVTVSSTNTAVIVTNDYPTIVVAPTPPEPELDYSVVVDKLNDGDGDGRFSTSETADAAGEDVEFQVTIRNTGTGSLVLRSLTDSVPGQGTIDLLGDDVDLMCTTGVVDVGVGSVLPPGSTTVCTFVLDDYAPDPGEALTNVITVVTDRDSDTDSSTVDTEEEIAVLPTPPVENPPPVPPPAVIPTVGTPPALVPPQQVASPGPEVRGDVVQRALPRTGAETQDLTGVGAFLIAVGAAMVLGSRRQLARR